MGATLIRQEDAPRFDVHGAQVVGYASPSRGSASVAVWKVSLDAGAESPLHSLDVDEVFVCLSGSAEFQLGAERLQVRAGDSVTIAAGTQFRFCVSREARFEAVACVKAGCRAQVADGEPFCPPWAI